MAVREQPAHKYANLGLTRAQTLVDRKYALGLDFNLLQDNVKRKSIKSARNLDSIQRIVYSVFSIWKGLRKKRTDKRKGMAELMRYVSMSFTRLMHFLCQKWEKSDFDTKITI